MNIREKARQVREHNPNSSPLYSFVVSLSLFSCLFSLNVSPGLFSSQAIAKSKTSANGTHSVKHKVKPKVKLSKSPPPATIKPQPTSKTPKKFSHRSFVLAGILGVTGFGGVGGVVLYLWRNKSLSGKILPESTLPESTTSSEKPEKLSTDIDGVVVPPSTSLSLEPPAPTLTSPTELLPTTKTPLLSRFHRVEELIQDLQNTDPIKRRLAIWNLGQQGDSRAVQPLIDLMLSVDSQQRSLILSALAEISASTLKPMKRALTISMQDESSQVRQNAIRDLLRICDTMGQMSYILRHALEDTDPEVQAIAKYALNHLNYFRVAIESETNLSENSQPEKK
jgi:hypothetical protein